jgi:hypothetical protein
LPIADFQLPIDWARSKTSNWQSAIGNRQLAIGNHRVLSLPRSKKPQGETDWQQKI